MTKVVIIVHRMFTLREFIMTIVIEGGFEIGKIQKKSPDRYFAYDCHSRRVCHYL